MKIEGINLSKSDICKITYLIAMLVEQGFYSLMIKLDNIKSENIDVIEFKMLSISIKFTNNIVIDNFSSDEEPTNCIVIPYKHIN